MEFIILIVAPATWLRLSLKAAGGGEGTETQGSQCPPPPGLAQLRFAGRGASCMSRSHASGFPSWQGERIVTPLSSLLFPSCPLSPVVLNAKW